jgi:hypothetical protein
MAVTMKNADISEEGTYRLHHAMEKISELGTM